MNQDAPHGDGVDGDEAIEESRHWIEDRSGHRYVVRFLRLEHHWRFRVYDGEAGVADAKCVVKGAELNLGDLEVFDAVPFPSLGLLGRIRAWFRVPAKRVSYRSRGVGSALLKLIVRSAVAAGLREISGSLSPRDLEPNPKLPDWYRKQGFTILPGGAFGMGRIQLTLRRKAD